MLLAVTGVATLLCSLGFWQLSRGYYKQALLNSAEVATTQAPYSGQDLLQLSPPAQARYHPVRLRGRLVNERTVLLDNKINNGQAGYEVLVPMALDNHTLVLINRGWIPLGRSRKQLPDIRALKDEVIIEGYLDFAYLNPLLRAALEDNTVQWPLRMQQVDTKLLGQLMNKAIFPMLVVLDKKSPYGFALSERKAIGLSPERHFGYAVQWFSLALTLLVCYGILLWRK